MEAAGTEAMGRKGTANRRGGSQALERESTEEDTVRNDNGLRVQGAWHFKGPEGWSHMVMGDFFNHELR